MKNILIVGIGNVGKYYFYNINKLQNLNIYLYDLKKLEKKNFISKKNNIMIVKKIRDLPKKINLLIISSTANGRYITTKKILKYSKINNFLIEKNLEQSPAKLKSLYNLLKTNKNVWINHNRRENASWNNFKNKFFKTQNINLICSGTKWNLLCNTMHFVDIMNWFNNGSIHEFKIKKEGWYNTTRKNFSDIYGRIDAKFQNGGKLTLISSKKKIKLRFVIFNKIQKWSINERKGIAIRSDGKRIKINEPYISDIATKKIIKKILHNKPINLPKFKDNYNDNLKFLNEAKKILNKNKKIIPIT